MNRYRVAMTVFSADSFSRDVDAVNEGDARRFAEQFADREYPDASEILVDDVELLDAAPEPTPDPLALARDIIAGLLDAVDLAATEFAAFSVGPPIDNAEIRRTYARARQDFGAKAAAARAFLATKEPTT